MISRVALDGTRLYASPAALDVFGYAPDELVGRPVLALTAEEDRARAQQVFAALSPERASHTWMWRGRRKDGSLLWLETSLKLVCDPLTGAPSEYVAVTRDASRGRQLQEALAGARDEAEHANRAKADFLAHMSHELRTPLNAIIGFASIIEQQLLGPVGTAKYAEYARDILGCGQHLLTLVNDILDFAKMDAGQLQLVEEPIDVRAMLDACVKMLAGNAEGAGVALAATIAPAVGTLRADARRLRQILLNLIGNSIKFTRRGARPTRRAPSSSFSRR
jgi:PAS domain S-box-containing protein